MPILHWLDRDQHTKAVAQVPYRLLEADEGQSFGDPDTGNMLIQGDNLDALKALLPYYAGRVKCIYADPPFNTQQAFADYDDNLEHSIWLSMMYPALELQRELLSSDGTIFIHIDDNELGYLMAITDEIMGRENRVSIITFKQGAATGHKAINPGMVNITNFILVYAKDKRTWKPNRLFTSRERDKRYNQFLLNPSEHFSEWELEPLSKAFSSFHGKKLNELKRGFGEDFEEKMNDFVISHAAQVIQSVRPDYNAVSEQAQKLIDQSVAQPEKIFLLERESYSNMYFKGGQRFIFYREKLKDVDGELVSGEPLTTLWDDILSNNLHKEGGVELPKSKKPEALIKRVIELSTSPGDIVLDAYLGSGTTAAVAQKMKRNYITIERGEHAVTKCQPRLKNVVDGEQSGVSRAVNWQGGGGFKFYRLGEPVFDAQGNINKNIRFEYLALHIWFSETFTALREAPQKPFLGVHNGMAYYLLYNGILGDKRPDGGNVLTSRILAELPVYDGPKVIYGEACRLGPARLKALNIIFKQTPYDVKAR